MIGSEERAWNKVAELEDLCESLSLMLKGRDDLLNATLKEKAELKRKLSKIQKRFEPSGFHRLNQIILGNEEEITDLRKDCEEYSKTFNRQNDEIVSLRKKMIKAKEIIKKLKTLYLYPVVTKDYVKRQDEILAEAEQFLKL